MKDNKKEVKITRSKRADLNKEFQEFKQKIQEFQNKNDQIINRIREAYTIKKQIANTSSNPDHHSRVVYYQQGDQTQSITSSNDYSKNIVFQGNLMGYSSHSQDPRYLDNPVNRQTPYSSEMINNLDPSSLKNNVARGYQSIQNSNKFDISKSRKATGRFVEDELDFEEKIRSLSIKNQELEQILSVKENEIDRLKSGNDNRFRNYASNLKRLVCDQFQNYQEKIIVQRMLQMENYFRKCDNRLKRLNLKVRDALEERRARISINASRSKRKRSSSRHRQSQVSGDMRQSWGSGPKIPLRRGQKSLQRSTSQSRQKQFNQIAAGYETMIKNKTLQIQTLEKQIREEIRQREQISSELSRLKINLEEKQIIIKDLKSETVKQQSNQLVKQKDLNFKSQFSKLQKELQQREQKQKELYQTIQKLQRSKKSVTEQQKDNYSKTINKKNQIISQLQSKLKQIQESYLQQVSLIKSKLLEEEKLIMEKESEIMALKNKIKINQNDLQLKDIKLKELEIILTKDSDPDLLERSMSMDLSMVSSVQIRNLQEALRRSQQDNEQRLSLIEKLEKSKYQLQVSLESIKNEYSKQQKLYQLTQKKMLEIEKEEQDNYQKQSIRQLQERINALQEGEQEKADLIEQREQLSLKNNELLLEIKKIKEENLSLNRQIIKINSQLTFSQAQISSLSEKLNKTKDESSELKLKIANLTLNFEQKEKLKLAQINELKHKNQQLGRTISDLQSRQLPEKEEENLLNSIHVSEISFHHHNAKSSQQEQIIILKEKLKEVQTALEMKQAMEQQIQSQYRENIERIKQDFTERSNDMKKLQTDNQGLKNKIKLLEHQQREDVSFENYKISLYEEKIIQLEAEYNSSKEGEDKLNELLHELTENLRGKEEERIKLINQLQQKEKALEELKELMELKDIKLGNKQSLKQSHQQTNKDFLLRLSGDQSCEEMSDIAEVSYFSNISDVFKKDDILQEKMKKGKTSRQQFIRLFTKTSAYIKSLKDIIETKEKRIKIIERQLNKQRGEKQSWTDFKSGRKNENQHVKTEIDREDSIEEYKDYDSVQIDNRRSKSYEMMKQLQHEKQLAVEQNKMLMNQIELLQDEIVRAQQQENSLVRIKDLYKEEIRKLMEKNQGHTQQFELQIQKLRDELDQCQSYHNWQALRQLFIKMINCIFSMEDLPLKQKREEKKKELDEYIKILASILKVEIKKR